ncbi:hypothetical protein H2199_007539 [Coniosporium tulheliwenetii]|uniref:Uncharacterized protein n=1 Tax=Coniosporium tulheliwenetii TaxID=3383036 RepID=A0ACC2YPP3_9PEZI|nr:hypothetical protein H2199_007539 [Cladosporium sp. JES 115]
MHLNDSDSDLPFLRIMIKHKSQRHAQKRLASTAANTVNAPPPQHADKNSNRKAGQHSNQEQEESLFATNFRPKYEDVVLRIRKNAKQQRQYQFNFADILAVTQRPSELVVAPISKQRNAATEILALDINSNPLDRQFW